MKNTFAAQMFGSKFFKSRMLRGTGTPAPPAGPSEARTFTLRVKDEATLVLKVSGDVTFDLEIVQ